MRPPPPLHEVGGSLWRWWNPWGRVREGDAGTWHHGPALCGSRQVANVLKGSSRRPGLAHSLLRPRDAEGRAPVMDDEGDPLSHIQGLKQGVEVAAVLDEAVRAGATVRQLVGVTHADQVGGDAAASFSRCGNTLRQRYDEVGLPCSSTMGRPLPPPRTPSRCRGHAAAAFCREILQRSCCLLLSHR